MEPSPQEVSHANVMQHCLPYLGQGELYSFCIYEAAPLLPDIEGVETNCPLAGKWEESCRNAWVSPRLKERQYDKEAFLRACGESQECAFDVIDWFKAEKIVDQMEYCAPLGATLEFHCREHALQSWRIGGQATAQEVEGLLVSLESPDHQVLRFVASMIGCGDVGQCAGNDEVRGACERALAGLSRGDWGCE